MSDKTKNCPIPGCGAPPEEEGNMVRCSHKRCEFSEWVTRVLWQALPRSTEAEQDELEKHLCEIAERVGFTGNGESVLDAVDRRLSALEGAAAHGSVWIVGRGNHDEIKVYAGADKKAAGEDFDSRVSSPYSKYQIKCDVIGTPTPPVSSYPQTCGTCGRFTPPDGDCYGCEADRLTARLAALEAAVGTVCGEFVDYRKKLAEGGYFIDAPYEMKKWHDALCSATKGTGTVATVPEKVWVGHHYNGRMVGVRRNPPDENRGGSISDGFMRDQHGVTWRLFDVVATPPPPKSGPSEEFDQTREAPTEVWVQQCHKDGNGFVRIHAHRPNDDHYTYRRIQVQGVRRKAIDEYPCDGCGKEAQNPRVYCSECMRSTCSVGKLYAPPGSCIEVEDGYMDIDDVSKFMEYATKSLQSYRCQLGKLPWIATGYGSDSSPAYPLTCVQCRGELDGLWCPVCKIGLSIVCPSCNVQAALRHEKGAYWCPECREEFSAYVPDTMISVVTTAGDVFSPPTPPPKSVPTDCSDCRKEIEPGDAWPLCGECYKATAVPPPKSGPSELLRNAKADVMEGWPTRAFRRVMLDVLSERGRQDSQWGEQNHDPFTWLTILGEEYGEACQAALHLQFGGLEADGLRGELIQVSAVAVAMVECLDRREKK